MTRAPPLSGHRHIFVTLDKRGSGGLFTFFIPGSGGFFLAVKEQTFAWLLTHAFRRTPSSCCSTWKTCPTREATTNSTDISTPRTVQWRTVEEPTLKRLLAVRNPWKTFRSRPSLLGAPPSRLCRECTQAEVLSMAQVALPPLREPRAAEPKLAPAPLVLRYEISHNGT